MSNSNLQRIRVDKGLILQFSQSIKGEQRDESAVPSYTHYNPLIRWVMFRRLDVILKLVEEGFSPRHSTDELTAFEFGCGVGLLLPALAKRVAKVYATDLCLEGARETLRYYGCPNVQLLPALDAFSTLQNGSLNVIIAADVLEHVDNLTEILKEFSQKLIPGGALIISGPTESIVYGICRKIAGFSGEYHVRNIFDIERVVGECGFRLVRRHSLPFPYMPKLFRISLFMKEG
jgi:2-polyprenyl-3-methyl-5-hydroxy-6-metoxy-1,4-benzoquinol methylase